MHKDEKLLNLLNLGRSREIISLLGRKKNRSDMQSVLLAVALSNIGKVGEAEQEYRRILKKDPSNFDAINNLGNIFLKKKRL